MNSCAFIKAGGDRCGATAMRGYSTCYGHRPDLVDERKWNAQKGGRQGGRGRAGEGKVAGDLHTLLEDLTNHVVRGELETLRGAVASQLVNTRIRLLEFERRVREQDEILARIEQLEHAQEQGGDKRHWGA